MYTVVLYQGAISLGRFLHQYGTVLYHNIMWSTIPLHTGYIPTLQVLYRHRHSQLAARARGPVAVALAMGSPRPFASLHRARLGTRLAQRFLQQQQQQQQQASAPGLGSSQSLHASREVSCPRDGLLPANPSSPSPMP